MVRTRRRWMALVSLLAFAGCRQTVPGDAPVTAGRPWLGVMGLSAEKDLPGDAASRFAQALRIQTVIRGSPAEKAGLKDGDLVVEAEGVDFSMKPELLPARFREVIAGMHPGDMLRLRVLRDRVDRRVTLEGRPLDAESEGKTPEALLAKRPPGARYVLKALRRVDLLGFTVPLGPLPPGRPVPSDASIFPSGWPVSGEETFLRDLVRRQGLEAAGQDLLKRLAACHETADPWRLSRMAYVHRNPYRLSAVSQALIREQALEQPTLPGRIRRAAAWLDHPLGETGPPVPLAASGTLEQRLDGIVAVLSEAKAHYDRAFARFSAEDWRYARERSDALIRPLGDIEPEPRLLALASNVDFTELFLAAEHLAAFVETAQGPFLKDLETGLASAGKDRALRETPFGPIVIAGPGRDWHKEDAAVLIDLGGDDFYTNHAGASGGPERPFSIVIDASGNDAYESSVGWNQGGGLLGVGILADLGGDDAYLVQDGGQALCALGVGILLDRGGSDSYRGGDLVQGAALWGMALLVDEAGNDTYTATSMAQAFALPGGFALLADAAGDDRYFAKGRHPTGYGNPGLFDGLSQGCGFGLRGAVASGGIALLADAAGDDRYEAGHFSQGGGYYFGWGLLYDGTGDDAYMGSRYAQGFAAHQAVGYFEDGAGNDRYDTRQGVAQGCSWDESVVAFLDRDGNDFYEGGRDCGFSQGASAHNGFCLFIDYGGDDIYRSDCKQGRSGPNDYHGGSSLSLFVDAGGGRDAYRGGPGEEIQDDAVTRNGEQGVIADLPGGLEVAAGAAGGD